MQFNPYQTTNDIFHRTRIIICIIILIQIHIYIMEYHLAIKKNERFLFAVTWVDLEGIMLSEIKHRNQLYVCDINFM